MHLLLAGVMVKNFLFFYFYHMNCNICRVHISYNHSHLKCGICDNIHHVKCVKLRNNEYRKMSYK